MWGARGPFLPAAAMVVVVVMQVVFCAKATKKRNKNTKFIWGLPKSLFIAICYKTYCNSYIPNSSVARARVVAWPDPEPLWSNGTRHRGLLYGTDLISFKPILDYCFCVYFSTATYVDYLMFSHLNPITNPTPRPNATLTIGATARNPNYWGSRVYPNYQGSCTQP